MWFCTVDKRCILKYSAPCIEVANQDCTCKESAEELLDAGYGNVKQAQIDVLNKVKNCREATDSDCYPYLECIVNKLIKEVENAEDVSVYKDAIEQSKNAAYDTACKLRAATHIFEEWLKEKNMLIAELRDIIQQYENMYPCELYQERLKVALTTCRRYEQTSFNDAKKYKITDKKELMFDNKAEVKR